MALLGRAKQKGQKMERQLTECGFEIQEQAWGEGKGRGAGRGGGGGSLNYSNGFPPAITFAC